MNKYKNNIKISKSAIIKWIHESWYSDFVLTNEIVFNTFKYSRIINSLDWSEDDQFKGYEDIIKKWDYSNWNDNELYLVDDYVTSSDKDE